MHEGDHGLLGHDHEKGALWARVIAAAVAIGAVVAFLVWRF